MPVRPTLHRPFRVRERKQWDRGAVKQKRITGRALQQRNARIKMRDRFTCQNKQCGLICVDLEVDHRIPVAAGGSDDDSNCRCLCPSCHSIKSRIEGHGKQLPNPDSFALSYAAVKRSMSYNPVDDECDDE